MVTDLIVGRYEILEEVGDGKKAIDRLTGREVILRTKPLDAPPAEELLERLVRLRQVNLAAFLHHFPIDGETVMITEFVAGRTLEELLGEGPHLDSLRAEAWMTAMVQGVHAVHEAGLLVGELTPSKIVVASDDSLKLLDAGFSGATANQFAVQNEVSTLAAIYRRMLGERALADPLLAKIETAQNCSEILTALEESKAPPAKPVAAEEGKPLPKSKMRFPFRKWDRRHVFAIIATVLGIILGYKFATHGQSQGLLSRWTGS